MKDGKTIVELATELQRRAENKMDFIADTGCLHMRTDDSTLEVRADGKATGYPTTGHTDRQLETWAGIPRKYADKMRITSPGLLAHNLNSWFQNDETRARRMVRTLDGSARAFLSDRYRRVDNEAVAESVLPILLATNTIRVVSCEVTARRLYLKAVFPKVEGEVSVGDPVQAGVLITNSEIGLGALAVQPLVYRLVCLNGMVSHDSGIRRYHVGRRVEGDGADVSQLYRDETVQADDKALMMKLEDVVRGAASEVQFGALLKRLQEAKQGPGIVRPAPAVDVLAKTVGLNGTEANTVLENLIRGGDYSRWGALNAVTATANEHDSYDRASELESLGGKILDLPASDWSAVADAV